MWKPKSRTRFSDFELGLQPRWFTGKEWEDGTAERESIREYKEATERLKREHKRQSN
jgi:hypothetical protein